MDKENVHLREKVREEGKDNRKNAQRGNNLKSCKNYSKMHAAKKASRFIHGVDVTP
jgi:hypothetical protein